MTELPRPSKAASVTPARKARGSLTCWIPVLPLEFVFVLVLFGLDVGVDGLGYCS